MVKWFAVILLIWTIIFCFKKKEVYSEWGVGLDALFIAMQ